MKRFLKAAGEGYRSGMAWLVSASGRAAGRVAGAAALLSAALLYYSATHLSINTDTADMLAPDLPFQQADARFDRAFPQLSDLIVVIVQADAPHRARDAADRLATALERSRGSFRSIYRPDRSAFFARNGLLYLDQDELWELSERLTEAQPFLGALARDPSLHALFSMLARALEEEIAVENKATLKKVLDEIDQAARALLAGTPTPRSWRSALLEGGAEGVDDPHSFILIQPEFDYASLRPAKDALDIVRRLARQTEAETPGVQIQLTGEVAIDDDELASVSKGAGIATSIAFVLVCAILVLGLRSPRIVGAILITLCMGLTWTAAFAAAAIGPLNLISVTFAVLFIGLGVDFGIQFGMRYKEELDATHDHSAALEHAGAGIGGTLTLAAAATAICFFSFAPTDYRGLAELGIISGFGMIVALLANLTVLPALLTLIPSGRAAKPEGAANDPVSRLCLQCLTAKRNRRGILGVAAAAAVGSVFLLPQARFDFNPLSLKDPATPSVAAFLSLLQDPSTTPYTIEILAKDLEEAQALADRLEKLDVVDRAVTLASFVPTDQEEKLRLIDGMHVVLGPLVFPSDPDAAAATQLEALAVDPFRMALEAASESAGPLAASAERLAHTLERLSALPGWPERVMAELRRSVIGDLPQVLDELRQSLIPTAITLENLPEDLKERYVAADGTARVEVFPKEDLSDNRAMRRFVKAVQAIAPAATGAPVTFVEAGDAIVQACLEATAIAFFATLALFLATLRRISEGLLALLPVALAAVLTAGSSVLVGISFNLANVIALPLLLGLSIAFGIYLVRRSRSAPDVSHLFRSSTSRAVFFSALTTAIAFGALTFSEHPGMASMGRLLMLALSLTLVSSVLILPAIWAEIEERRS